MFGHGLNKRNRHHPLQFAYRANIGHFQLLREHFQHPRSQPKQMIFKIQAAILNLSSNFIHLS
jgi:hypothetical protein